MAHIIYREDIPAEAIEDCSRPGPVDQAVAYWLARLAFDAPEADARAYCKATGAWDEDELADHDANLARVLWMACCDFNEGGDLVCLEG